MRVALVRLFGKDSLHLQEFDEVRYGPSIFSSGTPDSVFHEAFLDGIRIAQAIVRSAIQEFEDYELAQGKDAAKAGGLSAKNASDVGSRRIFLVHGHDDDMLQTVARFVERLELEVLILHEQASGGDTIIEKFERNSEVAFAVVLLSSDDVGARKSSKPKLQPRARQNVILELGYFIGKLGRERVCALVRGPLEVPSDFHGILYVPYPGNDWKLQLVRELKHAGFDVDANAAL